MPPYETPTTSGFYWAKHDSFEAGWEIVEVDNTLLVYVFGYEVHMNLTNFTWGPKIEKPTELDDL